ncbi:MAG: hypothetical protein ABW137_13905 [Mycobacterium sp.]
MTFAMVYLVGCVLVTLPAYVLSRRLTNQEVSSLSSLAFSVLAGLLWPFLIIGVVEFSSLAACSASSDDDEIPDWWFDGGMANGVAVPLR